VWGEKFLNRAKRRVYALSSEKKIKDGAATINCGKTVGCSEWEGFNREISHPEKGRGGKTMFRKGGRVRPRKKKKQKSFPMSSDGERWPL